MIIKLLIVLVGGVIAYQSPKTIQQLQPACGSVCLGTSEKTIEIQSHDDAFNVQPAFPPPLQGGK